MKLIDLLKISANIGITPNEELVDKLLINYIYPVIFNNPNKNYSFLVNNVIVHKDLPPISFKLNVNSESRKDRDLGGLYWDDYMPFKYELFIYFPEYLKNELKKQKKLFPTQKKIKQTLIHELSHLIDRYYQDLNRKKGKPIKIEHEPKTREEYKNSKFEIKSFIPQIIYDLNFYLDEKDLFEKYNSPNAFLNYYIKDSSFLKIIIKDMDYKNRQIIYKKIYEFLQRFFTKKIHLYDSDIDFGKYEDQSSIYNSPKPSKEN